MNNKFKGFLLGFVLLCSVISSVFAVYSTVGAVKEQDAISAMAPGSEASYILKEYEGFIAVFLEGEPDTPMTVTDIEVATLREYDQMLIRTGMRVQTHERLVMILEDLGS